MRSRRVPRIRVFLCAAAALLPAACGGSLVEAKAPEQAEAAGASAPPPMPAPPEAPTPARFAGPGAAGASTPSASHDEPAARKPTAMLAYEATVVLAVYQVDSAMMAVLGAVKDLDGQILTREDAVLSFRVPRERLDDALARIDRAGDVIHRDVRAEDVGDHYRDVEVRLRNARAMRDRLEQLLSRAGKVEDSLAIERELSRVTEEIERLGGEIQLLGQRVAYSKITVRFEARKAEQVHDQALRLPFPFLRSLGLANLLDLRE